MKIPRIFDGGRERREQAERLALEEQRQAAIDEKRQRIFGQTMPAAELLDCLKVPYDNRLLRAAVQVIRAQAVRYDEAAVAKPMDESAHDFTARKAALWELEELLLGLIDKANEEPVENVKA